MIELKNASLRVADKLIFSGLSFCLSDGEVMTVRGAKGSGKTSLLMAILGYLPLASGLISLEEELLTPASAVAFRQMTAYVPTTLQPHVGSVAELCRLPFKAKSNAGVAFSREKLMEAWSALGLSEELYEKPMSQLSEEQRYLVLVANASLLEKRIVLIDSCCYPVNQSLLPFLRDITVKTNASAILCEEGNGELEFIRE